MASEFEIALGIVAPVYNLFMAIIAFYLFLMLFRLPNRLVYMKPWYVLFAAFCVFLIEELLTILRQLDIIVVPKQFPVVNGVFEMVIVSLFIYMLFSQREYIKQTVRIVKKPGKK